MQTQLVIIQPTSLCNLDCTYCYLPNRSIARRINPETLEQIFKALFASPFIADEILFVWHASEPLVLPTGFYERAFQLQQRWNHKHIRITNAFQTNATLITQRWCQFFQEHDIHISVSLDGPQPLHDAHRVDKTGKGTFERVMRGVELLRANTIPYTVISVITSTSIQQTDEFWTFFSELRPQRLGLNPEEIEGINVTTSLSQEEDIQQYRAFLQRLLALNEQSEHPLAIREIENLIQLIRLPSQALRSQTNTAMAIISFDCDGNFSTFSPELLTLSHPEYSNFLFGNVFENSLEDIYNNPTFQKVQAQIQQGVDQCEAKCAYFSVCRGGFPSNKLCENGTFASTETTTCRLKIKIPTDVLLEHLERKYYLTSSAGQE